MAVTSTREARDEALKNDGIDFVVVVRVRPPYASPMGAAIYQGYGEEYVKAYLSTKMPAGSPVEIRTVTEVREG
jgi:hypothetical protein